MSISTIISEVNKRQKAIYDWKPIRKSVSIFAFDIDTMTEQEEQKKQKAPDDTVFVGQKPTMAYVLAVITQFSDDSKEVHIKARGRSISRAVDVAEVVRRKFLHNIKTKVDISTEEIQSDRGKLNVSTIDITLQKS